MTRGRKICDTLKDVRQRIADANGIHYVPNECHHEGECAGTCPACDAELRQLTDAIRRRRRAGMAATVAGLAVGLASLSACKSSVRDVDQVDGLIKQVSPVEYVEPEMLEGDVIAPEDMPTDTVIADIPDTDL